MISEMRSLVWLLGDAVGHIRQVAFANNHAPNNSGIFLYAEIVTPLLILVLTLYHRRKTSAEDI